MLERCATFLQLFIMIGTITIMKYLITIILLLFITSCKNDSKLDNKGIKKEEYLDFPEPRKYYITSIKGLNLRSAPDINSNNLKLLSYNEIVECYSMTSKEFNIDDETGPWYKCVFR